MGGMEPSSDNKNNTTTESSVFHNIKHDPVTSVLPDGDIPITDHQMDADEQVIVALGYKQEFKREFSFWTTFCVSFAVLGLLPSFARMGYAGTASMVWGWIIAMVFIQCVAMAMAELCSAMPTSGGLYYAAAVLAPPGYGPFAAWITGWSNWIGQITGAPSVDYGLAAMILAAGSINDPTYVPTNYQTFLLTMLILLIHSAISSMPTKWIAQFNSYGSTFNILALIIAIIAIPAGTKNKPKFTPAKEVWGTISNMTDFPDGVAVLMSFLSVIWCMSGYDSAWHVSEECSNANIASPRAIVMTSAVGGLMGWFLQLVVAYTVVDIDAVVNSDLGQPWASYLLQVMPKNTALAILALTIICGFSMGQGCMIAASRVTYAYARDDCFPLSRIWKKVNTRTRTPVNAVLANCALGILMCLLIFAGETAIGALFSIGAIAQFVAFAIPIAIRVFFSANRFRRGPWHLGRFGRLIGGLGVGFVLLMLPILCLPSATGKNLTPDLMNWTCLVYGAPMFAVMIWWVIDARLWFKGPKVNVEHAIYNVEQEVGGGEDGESSPAYRSDEVVTDGK
ncbi:hypothetical protein VTN00DRAFT_156 [Thermoascus crustaceus]|uniref:uncharacterized protein n=1 Tax=Thermoascus crustaceus TaxID=5088 RepID=UPI003742D244